MDLTGIGSLFDFAAKVVDKVFPNATDAANAKLELFRLQQTGELAKLAAETDLVKAQLGINQVEAGNESLFVAGGRPFVIWVGGFGLAYAAILEPIMRFTAAVGFGYTGAFPSIDTEITLQVLGGLLGLGWLRSKDKQLQAK
jgi:hypothetical protein